MFRKMSFSFYIEVAATAYTKISHEANDSRAQILNFNDPN